MRTSGDSDCLTSKNVATTLDQAPDYGAAIGAQVGGDHYMKMKIQPVEFILANDIPFCEANVIKYLCRWRDKNGIEDLRKARHYIELLMQFESR